MANTDLTIIHLEQIKDHASDIQSLLASLSKIPLPVAAMPIMASLGVISGFVADEAEMGVLALDMGVEA